MIFYGTQRISDLIQSAITARCRDAAPQRGGAIDFGYDFPIITDDYEVPNITAWYTHPPLVLAANASDSAQSFVTRPTQFILEHEVSNIAAIVGAVGNVLCDLSYGQVGSGSVDAQAKAIDAMLWRPQFALSPAIDQMWRVQPQTQMTYSYDNQSLNAYEKIQSAFMGFHNLGNLHEPYLIDGPPYKYIPQQAEGTSAQQKGLIIPANTTITRRFIVDAQRDFLLRSIIAPYPANSVLLQINNVTGNSYQWIPPATTGNRGIFLDLCAYNSFVNSQLYSTGFSPIVMGHRTQWEFYLTNITGNDIVCPLILDGQHCYYEHTPFNDQLTYIL